MKLTVLRAFIAATVKRLRYLSSRHRYLHFTKNPTYSFIRMFLLNLENAIFKRYSRSLAII